jgi:hypothetical protein
MTPMLDFPSVAIEFPREDILLPAVLRAASPIRVEINEVRLPENPDRRSCCGRDFRAFCLAYFPDVYWDPSQFHDDFARDLERLVLSRAPVMLSKALAAPRGIGKSTLAVLACLWGLLYGHVNYVLLLSANGTEAEKRLSALQKQILTNALLAADFPEICDPIRAFGGDPRRAPKSYPWTNSVACLPNGRWIEAHGLDGALAGQLQDFARPDFILIDDAETIESVYSAAVTADLERKLTQEIPPITPRGAHSVLLLICTIKRKGCLSDALTDAERSPNWRGERYAAVKTFPARTDLWDAFMGLVKPHPDRPSPESIRDAVLPGWSLPLALGACRSAGQLLGPAAVAGALGLTCESYLDMEPLHHALQFYAANKTAMDEGAEVLDAKRLPLWEAFVQRAQFGEQYFWCELQNNPPDEKSGVQLELAEERLVQRRVDAWPQRCVPAWAQGVLITLDLGSREVYWEASAWDVAGDRSAVIDCGMELTHLDEGGRYTMATAGDRSKLVVGVVIAAVERIYQQQLDSYAQQAGGVIVQPFFGLDCGGKGAGSGPEVAWYRAAVEWSLKHARCIPLKGMPWTEGLLKRAEGRNWCAAEDNVVVLWNTDEYKRELFAALERDVFDTAGQIRSGTRAFWAECPLEYIRHQTSEKYVEVELEERVVGRDLKRGWIRLPGRRNHWWDTAAESFALRDVVRRRLRTDGAPTRSAGAAATPAGPSKTRREY